VNFTNKEIASISGKPMLSNVKANKISPVRLNPAPARNGYLLSTAREVLLSSRAFDGLWELTNLRDEGNLRGELKDLGERASISTE
jgi:hypothetical protein